MARRRVAVVLLLPPEVTSAVDDLRREWGDTMLDKVAPHITLVPPTNVRDGAWADAVALMTRVAAGAGGPLTLTIGPGASFAPASPTLYLEVGGDVAGVAGLRDALLTGPLDHPGAWPFVPHVTVAADVDDDRLARGVAALTEVRFDAAVATVDVLVKERGGDGVAHWRSQASAPLLRRP